MSDKGGWVGQQCRKENDLCLSHELSLFRLYLLPLGSSSREAVRRQEKEGRSSFPSYIFLFSSSSFSSTWLGLVCSFLFNHRPGRGKRFSVYGVYFFGMKQQTSRRREVSSKKIFCLHATTSNEHGRKDKRLINDFCGKGVIVSRRYFH